MAGFFKKVFGGGENSASPDSKTSPKSELLTVAKLTEVIRYFPLGEKVRYYPEFQKDGALETIILGYGVNNQFVYSPVDIRCQQDGDHDVLRLTVDGHEQLVQQVESFCLLIPFNREDEQKRDYARRAELGPRGPFRRHNTITLLACSAGGTLSSFDTVVRRILPLESGIYAGHEVVLLDVLPSTLSLTDQRQHYRLQTSLPATLSIKDGGTHDCTLLDFSEESVQLKFPEAGKELASLTEYRRLTLRFNVGCDGPGKEYTLDGVMFRKTADTLVMKLQSIHKKGQLHTLGLVDILDIKANLLRHPATQEALAKQHQT